MNIYNIFNGFSLSESSKRTGDTILSLDRLDAWIVYVVQIFTIKVTRSSTKKKRYGDLWYNDPPRLRRDSQYSSFVLKYWKLQEICIPNKFLLDQ